MTRTRLAAHTWTTITLTLIATATYATTQASWWCIAPLLVSGTTGMLAAGHYQADRIARRDEQQGRNPGPVPPPRPCCRFWEATAGRVHDPDTCTRPPAARTTLTAVEEDLWEQLTAHLRKDPA